jgi:prefoldin subunit 5
MTGGRDMGGEAVESINGLITFLGSSLGVAIIGVLWQSFRYRKLELKNEQKEVEKTLDLRIKTLEFKVVDMDKSDTKFDGSLKRIHQRIDDIEKSHDKLEGKIEKDLQEVKKSISDLTALVIRAMQKVQTGE